MKKELSDTDRIRIIQLLMLRTISRKVINEYRKIYSGIIKILLYMFYHPEYMATHSKRVIPIFDRLYGKLVDKGCDYSRLENAMDSITVSDEDWELFTSNNNINKLIK